MGSPSVESRTAGLAGSLILAILLVAAAILFFGIYLIFPGTGHAFALLLIGILGVVFAVVAYLMESVSRQPTLQRATAWGFYAFGFATVFLTLGVNPAGWLNLTDQVVMLVVTLVILAGSVALIAWRYRTVAEVAPREAQRTAWQRTAPAPTSPAKPPAQGGH